MRGRAGLVGIVSLLLGAGLYLLFAGEPSPSEIIAAAPVALLATAYSMALGSAVERHIAIRPQASRVVAASAAALIPDAVRVGTVLLHAIVRRPDDAAGSFVPQPFRFGTDRPDDAGRRGMVTLGLSFAPNGFVVGAEGDALLIHRLAPGRTSTNTEWPT